MQDSGSVSDRSGSGGYGASSGFSGGSRSGSDSLSGSSSSRDGGDLDRDSSSSSGSGSSRDEGLQASSDEDVLPQHDSRTDRSRIGMRGRNTGRSDEGGMR